MNRLHAAVLATVIGAATLAPGSAYAASRPHSLSHSDTAGDVTSYSFSSSAGEPTASPEPTRTAGDIRATTAIHGARKVRMGMRLGSLLAGSDAGAYGFAIRTAKHRSYVAVVEPVKGSSTRARAHLENAHGRKVRCRLTWTIVPSAKAVRVSVPRSCIGRPKWVQTGMGTVAQTGPKFYVDDALRTGVTASTLDHFPVYGARLFR